MDGSTCPAIHDFDFLFGAWNIDHRRLDGRLVGATTWTGFAGTSVARPLFGGFGNIDENVLHLPSGRYEAATIRLLDPASGAWSIWWLDARHARIEPPVRGSFVDGVGTFFGDDVLDGVPIRVRFVWSDITATSAHWAQAFSTDGGATWETNWTMRFARSA